MKSGFFEKDLLSQQYPRGNGHRNRSWWGGWHSANAAGKYQGRRGVGMDINQWFWKRTFLATFERLKDLYLITSFALTLGLLLVAFLISSLSPGEVLQEVFQRWAIFSLTIMSTADKTLRRL